MRTFKVTTQQVKRKYKKKLNDCEISILYLLEDHYQETSPSSH